MFELVLNYYGNNGVVGKRSRIRILYLFWISQRVAKKCRTAWRQGRTAGYHLYLHKYRYHNIYFVFHLTFSQIILISDFSNFCHVPHRKKILTVFESIFKADFTQTENCSHFPTEIYFYFCLEEYYISCVRFNEVTIPELAAHKKMSLN